MPYNQWAYWAAGLPLTVLVVFGSLWFAGELGSIGQWIARLGSRSPKRSQEHDINLEGRPNRPRAEPTKPGQYYNNEVERLPSRPWRRTSYPRAEA